MGLFVRPLPLRLSRPSGLADDTSAGLGRAEGAAALPVMRAEPQPVSFGIEPTAEISRASPDEGVRGLYWGRLLLAGVFLMVVLVAGLWSASQQLDDWSAVLIHSFELLLGLIMGIIGGEYAARQPS